VNGGCLLDHTAYSVLSLLGHFYLPLVFCVYHYVLAEFSEKLLPAQAEEEITEVGMDSSSLLIFCLNPARENHQNCQSRRRIRHSGIRCLVEPGFCKVVTIVHFCHHSGLLAMTATA